MHTTSNFKIYSQNMEDTDSNLLFNTASDFSLYVETLAVKEDRSCTSVILEYCDLRDLDPEDIAKLISRPLKEKLMSEMQSEGLLPKANELTFE